MKKAIYKGLLLSALGATILAACKKETVNSNGKSPYGDPVLPSITFSEKGVTPGKGYINDTVLIRGKGFLKIKDKLSMQFSGNVAVIVELTDTTVKLKIPEMASTGPIAAAVDQEYYFGPYFQVFGPLQMDTTYPSAKGANNSINTILPLDAGKYLIGGWFTNYDNANIPGGTNRLARIMADGTLDRTFTYGHATGPSGGINAVAFLPVEQKYLVAGSFTRYSRTDHVYSLARVNFNGTLDSSMIQLPSQNIAIGSSMAGGVRGSIGNMYVQDDDKIIITGSFRYYVKPNYNLVAVTGLDSLHLDSTMVNYIARLHPDGTLDSTYNYDLINHRGYETVNGSISKSLLLPDGKLLIAGNFTSYNGKPVGRIARLNQNGTLDNSFNSGTGADLVINDLVRQPDGKIVIVGNFNRYNGVKASRSARILADGALDPSFNAGDGPDGNIYRVGLMPTGEIFLSGGFRKYAGIVRNNLVTLNTDGSIHRKYNTNGGVTLGADATLGGITAMIPAQGGEKAMLFVGSFNVFDYRVANCIVKLKYQ